MRRLLLLLLLFPFAAASQVFTQYFDGADTNIYSSVKIHKDTGSLWQIGKPQKIIFDSAATKPNALLTDTINNYLPNDTSSFYFRLSRLNYNLAIVAIRWKQKIDMYKKHAGGIIEFSADTGKTWKNVFNSSEVYKFYGYDTLANRDTLNGVYTISGTDTVWRDIWLCFEGIYFRNVDSFMLRYTFVSDTSTNTGEGWMIDNMMVHPTYYHTVKNTAEAKALSVYPTATNGPVTIEVDKADAGQIIEKVMLVNNDGKILKQYTTSASRFVIDIGNNPAGIYYLKVITNKVSLSYHVTLSR